MRQGLCGGIGVDARHSSRLELLPDQEMQLMPTATGEAPFDLSSEVALAFSDRNPY